MVRWRTNIAFAISALARRLKVSDALFFSESGTSMASDGSIVKLPPPTAPSRPSRSVDGLCPW
jgi:hypothetical protein